MTSFLIQWNLWETWPYWRGDHITILPGLKALFFALWKIMFDRDSDSIAEVTLLIRRP